LKTRPNQKSLDSYVGGSMPGAPPANTLDEEQKVLTPADLNLSSRQRPNPDANNEAFQPWAGQMLNDGVNSVPASRDARIVGDMVSGGPRDGYAAQGIVWDAGADLATGGRPDTDPHAAGLQGQALKDSYRSIEDYPGGQGSGTTPMQKGGQLGT